jgi:hypothetical protein
MTGRMIRASEVGAFVYCQRAWWYARQGLTPSSTADLLVGQEWHEQHARLVGSVARLRWAGGLLLVVSGGLAAAYLAGRLGT